MIHTGTNKFSKEYVIETLEDLVEKTEMYIILAHAFSFSIEYCKRIKECYKDRIIIDISAIGRDNIMAISKLVSFLTKENIFYVISSDFPWPLYEFLAFPTIYKEIINMLPKEFITNLYENYENIMFLFL